MRDRLITGVKGVQHIVDARTAGRAVGPVLEKDWGDHPAKRNPKIDRDDDGEGYETIRAPGPCGYGWAKPA